MCIKLNGVKNTLQFPIHKSLLICREGRTLTKNENAEFSNLLKHRTLTENENAL